MTTVQIDLPDRLAQEARRAGLLEPKAAVRLVLDTNVAFSGLLWQGTPVRRIVA